MFVTYLAFCEFIAADFLSPDISIWLTFIEFLVFNGLKAASINNYISAIKTLFKWFNLNMEIFVHPKLKLMLRAVEVSVRRPAIQKSIFDVNMVEKIIVACEVLPLPSVFRTIYLFPFFGFFRISNLAPSSKRDFKITKHLCRGDVLFHGNFLIVIVKWSKTLQSAKKGTYVILPELTGSRLCPVSALCAMLLQFPATNNAPLFMGPTGPIVQSQIRSHFNKVLTLTQLNSHHFSFHTFRRSGATLAFNSNVDLQAIKRRGTWTSDAVNAYIVADPLHTASVASSFQRLLC